MNDMMRDSLQDALAVKATISGSKRGSIQEESCVANQVEMIMT